MGGAGWEDRVGLKAVARAEQQRGHCRLRLVQQELTHQGASRLPYQRFPPAPTCSSSISSARLARTRRADSRLAMRLCVRGWSRCRRVRQVGEVGFREPLALLPPDAALAKPPSFSPYPIRKRPPLPTPHRLILRRSCSVSSGSAGSAGAVTGRPTTLRRAERPEPPAGPLSRWGRSAAPAGASEGAALVAAARDGRVEGLPVLAALARPLLPAASLVLRLGGASSAGGVGEAACIRVECRWEITSRPAWQLAPVPQFQVPDAPLTDPPRPSPTLAVVVGRLGVDVGGGGLTLLLFLLLLLSLRLHPRLAQRGGAGAQLVGAAGGRGCGRCGAGRGGGCAGRVGGQRAKEPERRGSTEVWPLPSTIVAVSSHSCVGLLAPSFFTIAGSRWPLPERPLLCPSAVATVPAAARGAEPTNRPWARLCSWRPSGEQRGLSGG